MGKQSLQQLGRCLVEFRTEQKQGKFIITWQIK